MSNSQQSTTSARSSVVEFDDCYARTLLMEIRELRRKLIESWQERGLTLTSSEQADLRDEIRLTCSLLTDLTSTL